MYPRKYTAAEWAQRNITLRNGEIGVERDTKKSKLGDGHTPWNRLSYQFDRAAADARYRKEINDLKAAVAAGGTGGGPALVADPNDLGTFIINNPLAISEDPADPGTYLIGA